jgi:hypothetical protein
MKGYLAYRKGILQILQNKIRSNGIDIPAGSWHGETRDTYTHILPLADESNTRCSRVKAIKEYLGILIDENFLPTKSKGRGETLHPYSHHLNSSQLLCYSAFRGLLNEDHTPKEAFINLLWGLGIVISRNARCDFEFSDGLKWENGGEMEGTTFDFHIFDNDKEYFFEIKFTENGFGKAAKDDRHLQKIKDIYLNRIAGITDNTLSEEDCIQYYQLIRNIIRAGSESKTVIFITDANNPSTNNDISCFCKKFLTKSITKPLFWTWQEICAQWPADIEKPFQFVCFEDTASV